MLVYDAHEPDGRSVRVHLSSSDGVPYFFVFAQDADGQVVHEQEYESWQEAFQATRPFLVEV